MTRRRAAAAPAARGAPPVPPVAPGLVLFLSVAAISWAAPLVRFTEAPALVISFWRLAFSVVLIAMVLTARGEWRALGRLRPAEWGIALLAGVFLAGHFVAWIASLALTTVAASVAIVSTAPIWVAVIGVVALGEHPSRRQWLGVLLAVAGTAWIGWGDFRGGEDALRGDLLALLGAVLVAAYYVIGRRLRRRIDIWPYVAVVYGCATLVLLMAAAAAAVPLVQGHGRVDWTVFLALAVGPMMIGHTGQNWALRYLPAYVVNLSLLGEPIGATLLAWLLPAIAEVPPLQTLMGGALILTGILLGMRKG
jgi:drug/metabolite transporter (DMT)-like permease